MERGAARSVEWSEELVFEAVDAGAESNELPPALGRQADHVTATILRIPVPLDEPALLQPVQNSNQLTAIDGQCVGDRRLGSSRLLPEEGQHAVVILAETGLFQLLERAGPEFLTQPNHEESALRQELLWQPERLGFTVLTNCDHRHRITVSPSSVEASDSGTSP